MTIRAGEEIRKAGGEIDAVIDTRCKEYLLKWLNKNKGKETIKMWMRIKMRNLGESRKKKRKFNVAVRTRDNSIDDNIL